MTVLIPVTVTAAAARDSASGDFSGGDYRRCNHRRASILDLSLLFWSEHVWFFAFFSLSSMDSSATTNASSTFPIPEHYTNYVNVHLSIDKLDGKNYDT